MHFLLFLITLTFSSLSLSASNSVIAVVEDEIITSFELKNMVVAASKKNKKPITKKAIKLLLDQKIDQLLQEQRAKEMGIQIRPESLQRQIAQISAQNNLSQAQFRSLPNYDDIISDISAKALSNGLKIMVTKSASPAIPQAIEVLYQQKLLEQASYQVANIILQSQQMAQLVIEKIKTQPERDFSSFAKKYSKSVNANSGGDLGIRVLADLPDLYQQAVKNMDIDEISGIISHPEQNLFHIIKVKNIIKKTDALIKEIKIKHLFIEKHKNNIPLLPLGQISALESITSIYEKILAGQSFSSLAKLYSQDDYAQKGGELPWIDIKKLPSKGQEVFDALSDSEISPPFESTLGWHIIQRISQKKVSPLRMSVKAELLNKNKDILYKSWLKKLRKSAHIVIHKDKLKALTQ